MSSEITESNLKSMIEFHTDRFLEQTARFRRAWHGGRNSTVLGKSRVGFSGLMPDVSEFNEYSFFVEHLEHQLREYLINPILQDLFGAHRIRVDWPKRCGKLVLPNNEPYERVCQYEFIIEVDGARVAYCYEWPTMNPVSFLKLLLRENISHVEVIDWSDLYADEPSYPLSYQSRLMDHRIMGVTVKSFFHQFFSDDVYSVFVCAARSAVVEANQMIGFQTIPSLTVGHLSDFRIDLLEDLRSYKNELKVYEMKSEDGETTLLYPPERDICALDSRFFDGQILKCLCGTEDFAVSFLTSEHLFRSLGMSVQIDYTSVICGYLKSVEQLLYRLIVDIVDSGAGRELWIHKRDKARVPHEMFAYKRPYGWNKNTPHVLLVSDMKEHFDTSLAPLANALYEDESSWNISDDGRAFLLERIRDFADEDRNGYFHKDNLTTRDYEEVVRIRNNARFILYMVLGGYVVRGSLRRQHEVLGIDPAPYDEIHRRLGKR